jgi:hypothetical protein
MMFYPERPSLAKHAKLLGLGSGSVWERAGQGRGGRGDLGILRAQRASSSPTLIPAVTLHSWSPPEPAEEKVLEGCSRSVFTPEIAVFRRNTEGSSSFLKQLFQIPLPEKACRTGVWREANRCRPWR